MNPIIVAPMAARLGPWLGRIATTNKTFLPSLLARLRVGGKFVGTKIDDVVAWVKANPTNAVMVATTIATLGYSIADLFDKGADQEVDAFLKGLDAIASAADKVIDSTGARSETLSTALTESRKVHDAVLKKTLSWARDHYGSVIEAVEGHRLGQAFHELSLDEVQYGFATLRLE